MLLKIIVVFVLLTNVLATPQLISFEDGKVGVNFGGFHASAGLGGLLTGNAAHGGLSASAGTPYGQKAVAGIGGGLNGQTSGGAYAGATAGSGVGAGALLGGNVGNVGSAGIASAHSYAGGVGKEITIIDEQPPKVDASYSNTFSIDKQVSIGGGSIGTVGGVSGVSGVVGGVSGVTGTEIGETPGTVQKEVTYVQKIKKHHRHHPHKVVYTEVVPQTQTNTQTYIQQQPTHSFEFSKFLNFGLFGHKGLGLFGRRYGTVQPETVVVEEKVVPQVVYEKRIVPKVVYEKRIVPEIVVEKKVIPQTVVVEKKVINQQPVQPVQPATFSFHKEVQIGKNIGTAYQSGGAASGGSVGAIGGTVSAGTDIAASNGGYSTHGSTFFDDIFNIPISTLNAVNRLVNNKVGQGNLSIQKTVEINKS